MSRYRVFAFMLLSTTLGLAAGCASADLPPVTPPAVVLTPALYTETNGTTTTTAGVTTGGNSVLSYSRSTTGALTVVGTYPTGGSGVGLPTAAGALPFPIGGATGAVRLNPTGTRLYAVDAGSADVAAFTIANDGSLTLIGRYPTGGTSPGSITIDSTGTYLYVLNTGSVSNGSNTPGGITGFTIASNGSLTALAGSTRPLSATTYVDPSQVSFSPNGSYLAVTEKASSTIDIYPVIAGVAGAPVSSPATGSIPFGFAFTPTGILVVSNVETLAPPAALTASTTTSYSATAAGALTVVSSRVPNSQGGACWVALTSDGLNAFVVNTLTGSISGYSVSASGTLALSTPGGATVSQAATTGPIDDVVSPDNAFLYVLNSNAGASPGSIVAFSIAANRSLTLVNTGITGVLLPGSIGLAIR